LSCFLSCTETQLSSVFGQSAANYTFSSATNGSLIDMSSGTTALLDSGTYRDDVASAVADIGFTFYFMAEPHTKFSINSNGQLRLGATAIGGTAQTPAAGIPKIAPISGDNAIRSTGKVHYKVTGTSPNRVLVVEWVDLRIPFSSATETGTYCKFQALLYESTGIIEYVYGRMYNMGTAASSRGIYFATGTTAGLIGQLLTITATPTYNSSNTSLTTTSFALSSDMINLNSTADGSRTVFTFTPNTAVTAPTNLSFSNIGLQTMTLSWTDSPDEILYAIMNSTDGINYSVVTTLPANTDTFVATNLTAGVTYYWKVIATVEGNGAELTGSQATLTPDPLHGIYMINNLLPTTTTLLHNGTDNFASFTEAITFMNENGISGSVTFLVTPGQTFAENCPIITATGTTSNTITFTKAGAGVNPVITPSGTAGSYDAGIVISGGDYITFNAIDITAIGDTVEFGYLLQNATPTNGAQNNIIANSKITLNRANTSSKGIYQYRNATASDTNGANSFNIYHKNIIENSFMGIYIYGSSTYPDRECIIDSNTVGAAIPNDIGGTGTSNGIRGSYQEDITVVANTVRNVVSSSAVYGIYLEGNRGTENYVFSNKLYSIATTSTSTSVVYGLRVDINSGYTVNIFNNMVSDLNHARTSASSTQVIRGISIGVSGTGTGNIAHNSVLITEDAFPSSAALYLGGGTAYVVNNAFANKSAAGATSKRYCIYRSGGTLLSDYNDFYIDTTGVNNFTGYFTTDQLSLADWQLASGNQDMNSIAVDPDFASNTNLHTNNPALDGAAVPIPGLTLDIDGDARDATNPDIGADEFTPVSVDMAAFALAAPPTAGCYTNAETVTVTIKNMGAAAIDFTVNPTTVNVNVTGAVTQALSAIVNTGTLASGATQNVDMTATLDMTTTGIYTFNAATVVTGDGNAANDAMTPATRTVVAPASQPQTVDFTGFTGTNLSAVFPGWSEGAGTTAPSGTTSLWTNGIMGGTSARINLYTTTRNDWIIGPKFTAGSNTILSFKIAITNWNSADPDADGGMKNTDDKVVVKVSTDCGVSYSDLYTFDSSTIGTVSNSLVHKQFNLSAYAGQNIIIAFYAADGPTNDLPDYDFHIDDIYIGDAPACNAPLTQSTTSITYTGATLNWISPDSFFDVFLESAGGPAPTPVTTPTATSIQGNTYTWTGGTPSTEYDWYVRTDCGFESPTVDNFWVSMPTLGTLDPLLSSGTFNELNENGIWYLYDQAPQQDWWNIWFRNNALDTTRIGKVRMGFWVRPVNPGPATFSYVINWSTPGWTGTGFPTPSDEAFIGRSSVNGPVVINGLQWIELYYVIADCNPEWISVDIWGDNIIVEQTAITPPANSPLLPFWQPAMQGGMIVHESLPKNSLSSWTGPLSFFTGYCQPAPSSVDGDGITNVTFSTVNNTTTTEPNNYGDYSVMTGDVTQGANVPVAITFETGYTYDTKIWIDWNDNLDFSDAGDEVYSGTSTSNNPTTLAASFVVPASAPLGNHRMRIGSQDVGPAIPCYTGTYGSFEDYTVNVVAPVPPVITSLSATSGCVGSAMTINGLHLADADSVTIGGTASVITANTDTTITVTVGTGTSGTVTVYTLGGTATSTQTFTINQLPQVFTVGGGGAYCAGSTGTTITLSGSESGVNYSLSTTPVTVLPGTGNALNFGPTAFAAGTYTITATNATTTCTSAMTGTATVTVNPVPTAVTASASDDTICQGASIDLFATASSNSYVSINYNEGFETWPPAGFVFINNNGTGNDWATSTTFYSGAKSMYYHYSTTSNADAWAITPAQSLVGGTTYTLSFWYKVQSDDYPEDLKVTVGNDTTVIAQTTTLWDNNGDTALINTTWAQAVITFVPSTSDNYYFGFNCYSDTDMFNLFVDELAITGSAEIPATYSWTSVPAGFTSSLQNPSGIIPDVTTQYIVTVENSFGCSDTASATVVVNTCGGYAITGKTKYAPKANNGSPAPNPPTYNALIYNIDNVIVILKNALGAEVARDTSDALGNYQFTNVASGSYILSYDKYTVDTMQWGNDVNAIDLAIIKYYVGADTLIDPSRNFSAKYKKAANVDNNTSINSIDLSRIKAKIGSPLNATKNFPKGNWVALDTAVTVAGANLNINLKTICYGDYNGSSIKYRDSLVNWSGVKSMPTEIIATSEEYITTSDPTYFEVPLRISSKMDEFSALGLELNYANNDYKLVSVSMPNTENKNGFVKINPTLEEIIADNNDLLVTDENGVIRVVFATTDHFDVAANDEIIRLGFRPLTDPGKGEIAFRLSGTGVMGNQYGEENEDAYLVMPKIFVQGNNTEAGFEFAGYPNPFSGEATLTYSIPANGTVKLNVYNAIGEVVSEVLNETQLSGKYVVPFSANNLPAGMYTFKLEYTGVDKSQCLILKLVH